MLRNAQIQADSGDVVALLGPNGAGKTTLLKAVLGLVKRSGSVELTRDVGILLDEGGLLLGLTGRQHVHSIALSHNLGVDIVLIGQSKIAEFDDVELEINYPTTFSFLR